MGDPGPQTTSKKLAQQLGLRPKTAKNYRAHIPEKLSAANMVAAIGIAIQDGLLTVR